MKTITEVPIFKPGTIFKMEPDGGIAAHTLVVYYEQITNGRSLSVYVKLGNDITYCDKFVLNADGVTWTHNARMSPRSFINSKWVAV